MKKSWLWSMLAAAAVVLLAGCESKEVKTVKNGVLGIDKSRTVEQALAAKLDDLKWEKFVNDKNQTVVKASGVWKDENTISFNNPKNFYRTFTIVKPGKKVEVYFVMNHDGTFAFLGGKFFGDAKDLGDGYDSEVWHYKLENLRGGFLGVLYD